MSVFFIKKNLDELKRIPSYFGPLNFDFDDQPVQLRDGREEILRRWQRHIYLLVEPAKSDESAIWYIGKSYSSISDRIKCHFGNQKDCGFPDHEWATYIDDEVDAVLTRGDVEIFTISISTKIDLADEQNRLLPELVEKYLLVKYALSYGKLPILNRQF